MPQIYTVHGLYFEEFAVGDAAVSAGRTVTEADIVNFAGLAGDYTQIHTNAVFAQQGFFGKRVAHGLLLMSIASGLLAQIGFVQGTVLALRELTWKFRLPAFIGDTIHVEAAVTNLKPLKRLGGGAVVFDIKVVNQDGKCIQDGQWVLLVASKSESTTAGLELS